MSRPYRYLIRPFLFAQDSENVHQRTLRALHWACGHPSLLRTLGCVYQPSEMSTQVLGLNFRNPIGLAAGMDKFAEAVPAWHSLGFGFAELGAVTWHPQPGNPRPRLFRIPPERALINRMGFNNPGAETFARTLSEWRRLGRWPQHPVGVNLGKSKITPIENAAVDYAMSFRVLWPYLDFFVVNVSSPNTPNLRQLQGRAALDEIFAALEEVQKSELARSKSELSIAAQTEDASVPQTEAKSPVAKPLLVKVAPDLSFEALDEILELSAARQIAGIVATNTTIARPSSDRARTQRLYAQTGGLSGVPVRERSTEVIRHLYRATSGKMPIIGVGGVFNAADAWEKIIAGASLVQVYTGLVYEGPAVIKSIVRGIAQRLKQSGMNELRQAVGSGVR